MTTVINEVNNKTSIKSAEFVEWIKYDLATDQPTRYYFSTAYKDENIIVDGVNRVFDSLGGLVQIGTQQRDIKATQFETSIILMGVDPESVFLVVDRATKGSSIRIWRGFYDDNLTLTKTYLRFTGTVTSYTTDEEYKLQENTMNLVLNCSANKYLLEGMFSGRKTNTNSWAQKLPSGVTDTAMSQVASLSGTAFDFGKKA
jgi:hypothetical protein